MVTAVRTVPAPSFSLPPRLAFVLTQLAPTPDPELALRKVLTEYIDLKIAAHQSEIDRFEAKWGMDFARFAQARADDTLGVDPYSFPVESDFWDWEAATTLLDHFSALRNQWI